MPTVKLNRNNIDKIDYPASGQVIYWDESLKGFGLRVTASRKTYIVQSRVDGKVCRVKIGAHGPFNAESARDEAKQLLANLSRGVNLNALKQDERKLGTTLAEAFDDFKHSRNLRPKTVVIYDDVMRRCFADWQSMPLAQITKTMVEERHRQLSNANGPRGKGEAQAHQAMRTLGTVFNFALVKYEDSEGKPLLATNPVKRLSEIRAWNHIPRRQTVIQSHQLKAWGKAVTSLPKESETIRDYLLLLLFTGLRRNEAAALKWSDVDLDAETLRIPPENAKNNREHILPLSDYLLALFSRRKASRRLDNSFVFPGSGRTNHLVDPKRQITQVIKESGVKFSSHDLRRSFLSIAEALDISHYALKKLANHRSASDVTQGYIINDAERLRDPMQRITAFIVTTAKLRPQPRKRRPAKKARLA